MRFFDFALATAGIPVFLVGSPGWHILLMSRYAAASRLTFLRRVRQSMAELALPELVQR